MTDKSFEKKKVILTPVEYERLESLRFEIKKSESVKEAKFLHKQIHTLLTRGKRRYMEKRLEKNQNHRERE